MTHSTCRCERGGHGGVGSSGYGPPGTSGKFPPHLHYGMYKDKSVMLLYNSYNIVNVN